MATTGWKFPKHVRNGNVRTPQFVNKDNVANQADWGAKEGDTVNITTHPAANVSISAKGTSDRIIAEEYEFSIKANARIDGVGAKIIRRGSYIDDAEVRILAGGYYQDNKAKHRYRKDTKQVVQTYGGAKDKWGSAALTPAKINSDDFGLVFAAHNAGSAASTAYMQVMGLDVAFTDPTYSFLAELNSQQTVGKTVTYKLTLKNTNNVHQGVAIPVSIPIPSGMVYVASGNGTYNSSTHKWNAVLSNGSATLTLTLQAVTTGAKTITASVDGFSTSISKNTTIVAPKYILASNLPEQVTQGNTVTYAITVTSDSPTVTSANFNLSIPAGLAFVSSSAGGTFNSSTGVWTASFVNQKATKTFTFTAVTGGEYNQILTGPDGSSLNKTILIISTDDTTCFFTKREIPAYIRALMTDGMIYTVSCYSKISDSSLTSIYPGKDNFKIAIVSADENLASSNPATGGNSLGSTSGFVAIGGIDVSNITISTEKYWIGSKSVKVSNVTQNQGVGFSQTGLTIGNVYTTRIWVYCGAGLTSLKIAAAGIYIPFSHTGGWLYADITYTATSTSHTPQILRDNTSATTFYWGGAITVEGTSIPTGTMDLKTGDLNLQEYELGTRVTELDDIERIYVPFEYHEGETYYIKINGQYINRSPGTATVRFFGFALHGGTDVNWDDPGILFDDINQLIQNDDYSIAIIPANEGTNPLLFDTINFSGHENDGNLIVKGVSISFDYYSSADIDATATLIVGDDVSIKSTILSANSILAEIGGDKWNLKNIDLNELSFLLQFDNNTVDTQTIQVTNVEITITYQYDETGGNLGFIMDGEHSRNYNMFLTKDFDISEGLVKDIDTLDIKKSVGDLITGESIKSKTIKLPFTIVGNSLEEFQERFAEAVAWMSNDLDDGKRPIPKPLVFDWDPDREWMVVLNDAVDKKYDIGKMEGTAEFLIPSGSAKGPLKTTGDVDSNNGLTVVKPLISLKATGEDSIIVKEAYSGKNLILNHAWDEEFILYIDCEKNRIYDEYGVDCTHYLALNSDLIFLDRGPFDFSQSEGCVVLSVQFNEGL